MGHRGGGRGHRRRGTSGHTANNTDNNIVYNWGKVSNNR